LNNCVRPSSRYFRVVGKLVSLIILITGIGIWQAEVAE